MDWLVASKPIRRDGFDWSFHILAGLVCFSCCSSTLQFICVLWQNWYPNALVQFSLLFWSRWVCAVNTSNHTESKKSFFLNLIHHLRPHPADQFGYMPDFCHQAQPLPWHFSWYEHHIQAQFSVASWPYHAIILFQLMVSLKGISANEHTQDAGSWLSTIFCAIEGLYLPKQTNHWQINDSFIQ